MSERPILFSAPMVRAILDGRKTQTRRVVKPQPQIVDYPARYIANEWGFYGGGYREHGIAVRCTYGVPGDRLWVRETWCELDRDGWIDTTKPKDWLTDRYGDPRRNGVAYRSNADADSERCREELGYRWRPSIHMPRWASRLTLEVVSVRVERLNDISEEDAIAEGLETDDGREFRSAPGSPWRIEAVDAFEDLWDSINEKKHPWASNPWVWVVAFKRINGGAA